MSQVSTKAPSSLDDGELARRIAAAGDGPAAEEEAELCRRYLHRVLRFGLRHLGADDRARDLAQDVLLLTIEKLRSGAVREPDRIGSFILGTARLTVRSGARRDARLRALDEGMDLPVESAAGDPLASERVSECLGRLEERRRAVILLTYYAEQSTSAIASSLGLTANHVRVTRHRGLRDLRSCMGIERDGRAV